MAFSQMSKMCCPGMKYFRGGFSCYHGHIKIGEVAHGKHRTEKEEKDLLNRLSRIEGQVRGIKAMVQDERYCPDILVQVSAVQSALNGFCKVLLSNHIKTCVVEDIRNGNEETAVAELCETIKKMM